MAVDLSGYDKIKLWIKSDRIGTYLEFGMGESAWDNNTWTVEILIANTWEQKEIDISGIADADKNVIRYLGFKCTNADSTFTFKYDDINTFKPETMEFLDSGIGTDIPLADKPITFTDSGTGVDTFFIYLLKIFEDSGVGSEKLVVDRVILFTDSGSGVEIIKVDKDLIFIDSGIGVDSQLVDKIVAYLDSGVGVDKFLKDWTAVFADSGLGVEIVSVKYPPRLLGRKIIFIRDLK